MYYSGVYNVDKYETLLKILVLRCINSIIRGGIHYKLSNVAKKKFVVSIVM